MGQREVCPNREAAEHTRRKRRDAATGQRAGLAGGLCSGTRQRERLVWAHCEGRPSQSTESDLRALEAQRRRSDKRRIWRTAPVGMLE